MSAIELEVKEFDSDTCPHCMWVHAPWEGASEMWSDRCMIWCYYCNMPYYYLTNETREPDWEV